MTPPASTISLTAYAAGRRLLSARSASRVRWLLNIPSDSTRRAPTRSLAIAANAPSNWFGPRASRGRSCTPNDRAADVHFSYRRLVVRIGASSARASKVAGMDLKTAKALGIMRSSSKSRFRRIWMSPRGQPRRRYAISTRQGREGPDMNRRGFLAGMGCTAVWSLPARSQPPPKVARIGWLTAQRAASLAPFVEAFRASLSDLGYVEGRNLAMEFRYGDDVVERVPALAAGLVQFPVDLIVAQGAAVSVLSKLNLPIPIVYVTSGDPVIAGFAETLAKPRGNMTGLTFMVADFSGKRLELLREIIPVLRRVAVVGNPEHPGEHLERRYSVEAGERLGLTLDYFPTRTQDELRVAFAAMTEKPPQAISLFGDGFAIQNRQQIIDFGMSHGAPVISGWPVFAQSGAICTYGPRLTDSYRRLAHYVDRILKGAKPAELPIEQPTTFQLVFNLKTAKALGITIPPTLLARADDVID